MNLQAQVIPATQPDNFASSVTLLAPPFGCADDATLNNDMLMTRHSPNPLKVIVWDEGSVGSCGLNIGSVHIRVEDWNGNVATATISNAAHPDVVLGDDAANPGTVYNVAVAYVKIDPTAGAAFPIQNRVSFFNILQAGTPAINLVLNQFQTLGNITPSQTSPSCTGSVVLSDTEHFPHLDIIPRPGFGPSGLPLMEDVIITYDDGPAGISNIWYCLGSMTAGMAGPPNFVAVGTDPDVAGQVEMVSNNSLAYFVYNQGPFLKHTTINLTNGTTSSSTIDVQTLVSNPTYCSLFPRIEAMNMWHSNLGVMPWQAVGIKLNLILGTHSEVKPIGYNPFVGAVDLYDHNVATPMFYALPDTSINVKSPSVSAGCGRGNSFGSEIGNRYYTVGYYPWATDYHMYARYIDASSGMETPDYYQINQGIVDYSTYCLADASKSLALSNCSNTGHGQYASWYDAAGSIMDKTNLNTTPQFKTTGIKAQTTSSHLAAPYPNPVTEKLFVPGAKTYTIYDLKGTAVQRGNISNPEGSINTINLPIGTYLLQYSNEQEVKQHKFTKQ